MKRQTLALFLLILLQASALFSLPPCLSDCCCSGEEACWVSLPEPDAVTSDNRIVWQPVLLASVERIEIVPAFQPVCFLDDVPPLCLLEKTAHPAIAPPLV
ncbi:MAG: hypothetical protein WC500_02275 [Candidatus Margulisiibacteriota bacterium]